MMTNETQQSAGLISEDGPPDSLKDDILRGAAAISDFIGDSERRTQYKLERGLIPAGKDGRNWVGSKRRLRRHYERITAGGTA